MLLKPHGITEDPSSLKVSILGQMKGNSTLYLRKLIPKSEQFISVHGKQVHVKLLETRMSECQGRQPQSLTVPLLVCLKLNWVRKGMVQYKLSWLSFKVSSIFAVGKSCLCLFQCQCFPLNGLLCWHLSLLTCMPHAVYIFPKHSPK